MPMLPFLFWTRAGMKAWRPSGRIAWVIQPVKAELDQPRWKVSKEDDQQREDEEFADKHSLQETDLGIAIKFEDRCNFHEGRRPLICWPHCCVLFSMRKPGDFVRSPISHTRNLRDFLEKRGWRRGEHLDPPTHELKVAAATPVDSHSFRMLNGVCKMERPLAC